MHASLHLLIPPSSPTSHLNSHSHAQAATSVVYETGSERSEGCCEKRSETFASQVRKGKDPDINRAKDFVSTHNEMNERGWAQ
eukprot:1323544-Amorphochlora_amoeboformis.AAC.3